MVIIRSELPTDYYTILRNSVVRDERLSYRARGVLASILSNRTGWRVTVQGLADRGPEGRDAVSTAVNELVSAGYLVRERRRDEHSGKLVGTDLIVYDTPQTDADTPQTGGAGTESLKTRNSEKPELGESSTKKELVLKKELERRAREAGGDREQAGDDREQAAALLGAFLDRHGAVPLRKVRGRWQREIESLLAEDVESWMISKALDACAARNAGPGLLAHLAEDIRSNPEAHRDLPIDQEWLRYGG